MPPKSKITKGQILTAALTLLREQGESALNARTVAGQIGCSTQPIFCHFPTMQELKLGVLGAAYEAYAAHMNAFMAAAAGGPIPPYKASGLAYIAFARQEPNLFRLLFMRDRTDEPPMSDDPVTARTVALIREKTGLSAADATRFHLEMWIYVHGVATMLVTAYVPWTEEDISAMLTEVFEGLRYRFLHPNKFEKKEGST